MSEEKELTPREIETQDAVDGAILDLVTSLAPEGAEIEWDAEWGGEIRDIIKYIIVDKLHLMTEMEFYPYIEREEALTLTKCIVAATNANGEPDFYFVMVESTQEQYDNGDHYEAAKEKAKKEGYEPRLVFDQNDEGGKAILEVFDWRLASTITVGKPHVCGSCKFAKCFCCPPDSGGGKSDGVTCVSPQQIKKYGKSVDTEVNLWRVEPLNEECENWEEKGA